MKKTNKIFKNTLSQKLYLSTVLLVLVTVLITGGISLYFALSIKQEDMDTSIDNLSYMVSQMDIVQEALEAGETTEEFQEDMNLLVDSFQQVDVLVVCDVNSTRIYHTDPSQIGQQFRGDDQADILAGSTPYISEAMGTLGMQRRSFHSVTNDKGEMIGFVMASVLTASLDRLRLQIAGTFLILLAVLIPVGCLLAGVEMYHLQILLMGYQPEEFRDLYIERTEVMDALEEGIFAINTEGNVILMNETAKKLLQLPDELTPEGKPLKELFPPTKLDNTVRTGIAEHNINFNIGKNNIISSRIPIRNDQEEIIGAVSIFRNKTEVTKLAEELTGAKYMVDTLRAFNHEFMNKLHIILGLLEMGQTDEAKKYILETSLVSGEAVSDITHRVPISTLAALLIGKMIRATELGIKLTLKSDSYFHHKQSHLPTDCYITIIGNLLENAMDELNGDNYPLKEIELGIYSEDGHTIITCDDTGGGIPEEILFSIYDRHTTTKGEGHGTGMAVIRELTDRYEGTIHIDTELGEGTSIEIILPI